MSDGGTQFADAASNTSFHRTERLIEFGGDLALGQT